MKYDPAFMPIENNEQITNTNYDSAFTPIQSQPDIQSQPKSKLQKFNAASENIQGKVSDVLKGYGKYWGESALSKVGIATKPFTGLVAAPATETTEQLNKNAVNLYEQLLAQASKEQDINKKSELLQRARDMASSIGTRGTGMNILSKLFEPKNIKVGEATLGERLKSTSPYQTGGKILGGISEFALTSKAGLGSSIIGNQGTKAVTDIGTRLMDYEGKAAPLARIVGSMYKVIPEAVGDFATTLMQKGPGSERKDANDMIKEAVSNGLLTEGTAGVIQAIKEGGNVLRAVGQDITGWTTSTDKEIMKKAYENKNASFIKTRWGDKKADEVISEVKRFSDILKKRASLLGTEKKAEFDKLNKALVKIKVDNTNVKKDIDSIVRQWEKTNSINSRAVSPETDPELFKAIDNIKLRLNNILIKKSSSSLVRKGSTANDWNKAIEMMNDNERGISRQTDALIDRLGEYVNGKILPSSIRNKYESLKIARQEAIDNANEIQTLFRSGDNEKAMKKLLNLTKNSSIFRKEMVETIKDVNPNIIDEIYGIMGRPPTMGGTNKSPLTSGAVIAASLGSKLSPWLKGVAAVTLVTSPKAMTNFWRMAGWTDSQIGKLNKVVSQFVGYPSIIPGVRAGLQEKQKIPFLPK